MSILDQLRQKMPQQGGGMQPQVGMAPPMGGQSPFPFAPNRPQFQQAPIPPGLSPGMQQQAQFERRPPMMAPPNLNPAPFTIGPDGRPMLSPGQSPFKAFGEAKESAQRQMALDTFLRGTAQARRETDPRRAMFAQLAQRPVGGFGYGNLEQYVRSMQSPGLRY